MSHGLFSQDISNTAPFDQHSAWLHHISQAAGREHLLMMISPAERWRGGKRERARANTQAVDVSRPACHPVGFLRQRCIGGSIRLICEIVSHCVCPFKKVHLRLVSYHEGKRIEDHSLILLAFFGSARVARTLRFVELLWPQPVRLYVWLQQVCWLSRSDKWHRVRGGLRGREVEAKKPSK